jgi:hypothetical protein
MAIDRTSDQFLLDAYSGKGGFATGAYLVPHPREDVSTGGKFDRRKELAVYPNYCRKIVNVFMGFLWKQAPNREADELYSQFMANANGAGSKLDALLFAYQRLAMILGTVYIIVDKPKTQGQTRADQTLPYLALRLPGQLVAETKDAAGRWTSVTFLETLNGETVYRTFKLDGWILSKQADGTDVVEQGEYKLGRVPVVRFHIEKPLDPTDSRSQSWFYDLAGLNWDLYNARSELRELFRAQTFAILKLPARDETQRQSLNDLTISTENALAYDPTDGGDPGFIAPPADPVNLYMQQIANTVNDIYRVANLEFVGGVQQSGVALSFHFQEANSSLGGMAGEGEAAETEIASLVYAWQGREFAGNIAYPSEFNMTDVKEALAIAMDSIDLGLGDEFNKAVKKRVARQILANDTAPSTMQAIDDEIDALGDTYGDRVKRESV